MDALAQRLNKRKQRTAKGGGVLQKRRWAVSKRTEKATLAVTATVSDSTAGVSLEEAE